MTTNPCPRARWWLTVRWPRASSHGVRCLLLAGLLATWLAADPAAAGGTMLAPDGKTLAVTAPGMRTLQGDFAATIIVGGQQQNLSSTNGTLLGPVRNVTEVTPYGPAEMVITTVRFDNQQVNLQLRIGRVPGMPGVLAQAGIRNTGTAPINLLEVTPLALTGQVVGKPADWLITALLPSYERTAPVIALNKIRDPLHIEEYGSCYRNDGTGFLFAPVGDPIAFVHSYVEWQEPDRLKLTVRSDLSGVQVAPGEVRWGQQVVLLMAPPQAALERWAEWVATTHGAHAIPSKGALSGWSSWYFLGGEVAGTDVLAVADAALKAPNRLHPAVIQIDQGYRDPSGRNKTNDKFPEGLAFYAQRIAATGARPGLRVSASMAVNPSAGGDLTELLQQCREAVRDGFTYLKFDLNYKSAPFALGPATARKTSFEMLREQYAAVRQTVGPNTYLMCCDTWPIRAQVGVVDASRTGHAANRLGVRTAMGDVLSSYQLHNRWFAVDNDAYYIGTEIANISRVKGGWPLVRTWMSMVGLSCGAAITSDPWHWEGFKPYLRNVEVLTPPAREQTKVLDMCINRDWSRLVGHVKRAWGDMSVALLWNSTNNEIPVTLDFAEAGLDSSRRYAVWSFWDNRYLGVAEKSWTTPALAPGTSQHLRFTDLDSTPNKPVLIGSNLHIYCGASEIERITSLQGAMEIELGDAGARAGDLFVYSRLPLVLKEVSGCAVNGITSAGEYVWRISINQRQRGVPQRVELTVLLPVTRQLWFWLLIALVAASLLFTGWRYVASQRLQREHALDQERARIARDLHDDLGAGLTEIAMLSDMARQAGERPATINAHLERIFRSGREMTQALDEIVWAINPSNDTLEKLLSFTCEFAQGMLEQAGIRCRLDVPISVPALDMDSKTRHQLCMALKESLHNIIKHAHANEVLLRISLNGHLLDLMIADDGVGFDPAGLPNQTGTHDGLHNLRQRMADIHGTCDIQSAPGQGTRVLLQVKI